MKLKFLGTAAAEAVPAPFCECDVCEHARKYKGKNIRTRAQAIVDDKILIDFGPDTVMHSINEDIKLCKLSACIITHPHMDHLFPEDLFCRVGGVAHMKEEKPFVMYGMKESVDAINEGTYTPDLTEQGLLIVNEVTPFVPFEVDGYKITPLKADHSTKEPVIYIIEKDGKSVLYAHDTGLFPDETYEYLRTIDTVFDVVSYDCTNVLLEWDNRGHMGLTGNVIVRDKLKEMGRINDKTINIVNHFSHNGLAGYDDFTPIANEKGFEVAYDGMEVEF